MIGTLSPEQESFCYEYVQSGNAVEAYKKSHRITSPKFPEVKAKSDAAELLENPDIKQKIVELKDAVNGKDIFTKEQVLQELSRIARTAPFHSDRNRALDLLGKYHRLFQDEKAATGNTFVKNERTLKIVYMVNGQITTQSPLRSAVTPPVIVELPAPKPVEPDTKYADMVLPTEDTKDIEDILSDLS